LFSYSRTVTITGGAKKGETLESRRGVSKMYISHQGDFYHFSCNVSLGIFFVEKRKIKSLPPTYQTDEEGNGKGKEEEEEEKTACVVSRDGSLLLAYSIEETA